MTMKRRLSSLGFLLASSIILAGLLSGCLFRARGGGHGGWVPLGERVVQGGTDHDVIHVGARDGWFTHVKLEVEHSALELYDVTIVFGDGQTYSPGTRLVFGQGTWSRAIDLPGGARHIQRVEFHYGNLPGGGRARLRLWGL